MTKEQKNPDAKPKSSKSSEEAAQKAKDTAAVEAEIDRQMDEDVKAAVKERRSSRIANICDSIALMSGAGMMRVSMIGLSLFSPVCVISIILYLILSAIKGEYVDQVSAGFNLIAGVVLVIFFSIQMLARAFGNFRGSINKVFLIVYLVVIGVAFFVGYTGMQQPHSLIFPFRYQAGLYSGLAMMTWPAIITYLICSFFGALDSGLAEIGSGLFLTLIFFFAFFMFSTIYSIVGSFNDDYNGFSEVVEYYNNAYDSDRNEAEKTQPLEEYILSDVAANSLDLYKFAGKDNYGNDRTDAQRLEFLHRMSGIQFDGKTKDLGFHFDQFKWVGDYGLCYRFTDRATKEYVYYCDSDIRNPSVRKVDIDTYNTIK